MAMKRIVVRYRTKPEAADANAQLIAQVFQELKAKAPAGVRYLALRLEDDTFIQCQPVGGRACNEPDPAIGGLSRLPKRHQGALPGAATVEHRHADRQLPRLRRGLKTPGEPA